VSPHKNFDFYDTQDPNHIWLVTLTKSNQSNYLINYTAIDMYGVVKNNESRQDVLKPLI